MGFSKTSQSSKESLRKSIPFQGMGFYGSNTRSLGVDIFESGRVFHDGFGQSANRPASSSAWIINMVGQAWGV